jgi:hypothetical protein
MTKRTLLHDLTFGQRVAEEETDELGTYFVETDHWQRLYRGDLDIVYGPKGSGKSALYALLISKRDALFDRSILLVPGENPRGATAFHNLITDPPASEREFIGMWKLYIASLMHSALAEFGINDPATKELEEALAREGLVKGSFTLGRLLSNVLAYARRAFRGIHGVEGGLQIDPHTQLPKGFTGKITFSEPTREVDDPEVNLVDRLLDLASTSLSAAEFHAWILFDRLDVAFSENQELENNALRALFRVYLDCLALSNVHIKIFLRSDIWNRITHSGFREASHITRHVTINWNESSLLNLVLRRCAWPR